ncbi:MAG: S9 family peptidase [Actinobacteria bacterium]|nr:S9 family peptidase [Actinomycetota bacterium]
MAEDRGRQVVVEVKPDLTHEVTYCQQNYVTGLSTTSATTTLAVVLESVIDPGELVLIDDGEARTVSAVNEDFRSSAGLRDCEHFVFDRDGIEFDVWVYLPAGDGPVPVLFNIHGGPATQYGWSFFDEFQVELGAGYAVVATNPRSASGHGEDFVRGALKDWGSDTPIDAVDLLTALDQALTRFDRLDRDRVGVMGGSYGGLIIAKILSFDHRFKSAIPERGLYNWVSFAGVSDIGLWFGDIYVGDRDYSDWSELWNVSSIRTAHKIRTPCLVIHSESDFRCPIDQGEQLFSTLLANGVTAEFLRFPGESHELSRSGSPRHRVERFEAVIEWHGRFLG